MGPDLQVRVPHRGIVASAAILTTATDNEPTEVSVFRSAEDRLAIRVDGRQSRGDAAAASQLTRIVTREHPTRSEPREAAPTWYGSTCYYSLHNGRWSGSQYRWLYNSDTQPDSGALSAITYGFKFITDDSSA